MPFGLRNAAQALQRYVDQVLKGLPSAYAYINDILVATDTEEEHSEKFEILSKRLHDYGIAIDEAKSIFGLPTLEFLGIEISNAGIIRLPSKVVEIQNFPQPTLLRKMREFLGIVSSYRRFILSCAEITRPLADISAQRAKNKDMKT